MSDLLQSFNRLVNYMFENINGCLVERLPDNKYRWHDTVGTREEIIQHQKEVWEKVGNNEKNKKQST